MGRGWREAIEGVPGGAITWSVAYATSDYCRTAAPPLWDDLPAALTWDTVDPAGRGISAVCIPPQPSARPVERRTRVDALGYGRSGGDVGCLGVLRW